MASTFPNNSFWLFSSDTILLSIFDSKETICDWRPSSWFFISSRIWSFASPPEAVFEDTSVPVNLDPPVISWRREYYFEEDPLIEVLICCVALVSSTAIWCEDSPMRTFFCSCVADEKTSATFSSLVKSAVC